MIKHPSKFTRKILLSLPRRDWKTPKEYDHLLIVPTGKKHDSGWALIAIVGINYVDTKEYGEIAAYCDDIMWNFPKEHPYGKHSESGTTGSCLRTDMYYPSGIVRMWATREHYFSGKFKVGCSLSTTEITLKVVLK